MKKIIAGAALVTTLLGSSSVAVFADTNEGTPVTTTVETTTTTTAAPDATTTLAPDATTTATPDATTTASDTTVETTADVELPEAGMTPDSFFYGLKLFVEQIQLFITRDAVEKASLLEAQAQTRLAEAKAMAEAGKADLAAQAMAEAELKLVEAQKQITAAVEANKDVSKLVDEIDKSQIKFATLLGETLEKLPENVQAEFEPVVAQLLIQIATTEDAIEQDEEVAEEADQVAEEAELKDKLEGLQPRMVLVLNAMAEASGKPLADVVAMYQQNPGLGRIAKSLGLKMGAVQHAAQANWKKGGTIQISLTKVEPAAETEEATEPTADAAAQTDITVDVTAPEVSVETSTDLTVDTGSFFTLDLGRKEKESNVKEEKAPKNEKAQEKGNNGNSNGKGNAKK